jgi:uncharacterized protein (UPF0332 family)
MVENNFEKNLLNNLMETWVLPSIRERQAAGDLEKPLSLQMAQIIFKADGEKPLVRVNGEVKGKMIAKLADQLEAPVEAGDPVQFNQISGIEAFELDEDDNDHGHATLISFPEKWFISFNFIYNKRSSQQHLSAAKEFLHAAKSSFNEYHLRACIDTLHSASELAAKAYLLGRPDKSILEAKSHDVVHRKINIERKLGNVENSHIIAFNKLRNLRGAARYLRSELTAEAEEIEAMLSDVEEFINNVSTFSKPKL